MTTKTEGEDFSLHERPSKRGPVFYCQFRKDDGTWSTAKSTHVRVGRGRRAHDEALKVATAWAQSYMLTGEVVSKERGTFETFAEGFFDWNGEWAREKRRRGHRISQEKCDKHAQSTTPTKGGGLWRPYKGLCYLNSLPWFSSRSSLSWLRMYSLITSSFLPTVLT